jgi:hypothetical protein
VALALTLALLGVLLAVLALLMSIRTERHLRRLAHALAREWGLRTGGDDEPAGRAAEPATSDAEVRRLRYALDALEQQVRELAQRAVVAPRPTPPPSEGAPSLPSEPGPQEHVRRHLAALGYEDIVVLPGRGGPGAFLYEAREQGMPRKGGARVDEAGRVELQPARLLRVFP